MPYQLPIGLNPSATTQLGTGLNALLSDCSLSAQNVWGMATIHQSAPLLADLHDDLSDTRDALASRLQILGTQPLTSHAAHAAASDIPLISDVPTVAEAARHAIAGCSVILVRSRALHALSGTSQDIGTQYLLAEIIASFEQWFHDLQSLLP
jgi:DNA-binding ferritin-like protein